MLGARCCGRCFDVGSGGTHAHIESRATTKTMTNDIASLPTVVEDQSHCVLTYPSPRTAPMLYDTVPCDIRRHVRSSMCPSSVLAARLSAYEFAWHRRGTSTGGVESSAGCRFVPAFLVGTHGNYGGTCTVVVLVLVHEYSGAIFLLFVPPKPFEKELIHLVPRSKPPGSCALSPM